MSLCLLLYHFAPNKVAVPLKLSDKAIIATNLGITGASALLFYHVAFDKIYSVEKLTDVPLIEVLYLPLWIVVEETIFFYLHRYLHQPGLYEKCHKWHHHFKVTSSWTSFYAHPLDQLISVVWSAMITPLIMCMLIQRGVCVVTLTTFFFGAIVTFIGSHHSVNGGSGKGDKVKALGSNHLEHHMKFNVNFGNFGYFDKIYGSFGQAKIDD